MIRSILLAVDNSPSGNSALSVGLELAKLCGASVKGLYVEDIDRLLEWQPAELIKAPIGTSTEIAYDWPTEEQLEIEKEYVKEGECLKKLFEDVCNSLMVKGAFVVRRGKVDAEIIEATKTVDLIVVGRRGKTYPQESKEPGHTTENLLRHTTRPVLVVPAGAKLSGRILIAYDGSRTSQRALREAAYLTTVQESEVEVITVSDEGGIRPLNEAREFLEAYMVDASYRTGAESSKPWNAIMKRSKDFKAGLIVLGAYGENMLVELIFGSTTRHVLMEATCPVLLCR